MIFEHGVTLPKAIYPCHISQLSYIQILNPKRVGGSKGHKVGGVDLSPIPTSPSAVQIHKHRKVCADIWNRIPLNTITARTRLGGLPYQRTCESI